MRPGLPVIKKMRWCLDVGVYVCGVWRMDWGIVGSRGEKGDYMWPGVDMGEKLKLRMRRLPLTNQIAAAVYPWPCHSSKAAIIDPAPAAKILTYLRRAITGNSAFASLC